MTGGIAGKPADVVILDDLVKDRRTARSAAFKRLWKDQWQSNIKARLGPGALVVMDHTRWAEDDPIGQQLAEHGDRWKYLNIPAIVESRPDPDVPFGQPNLGTPNKSKVKDPLGREEGVWLESARGRTPEQWAQTRKDIGEADFWSLWQGHPFPASGGLFKRADIRHWTSGVDRWQIVIPGREGPPEEILRSPSAFRFITVDLAASTKTAADWTVAAAWAVAGTGELIMLDLRRAQVDPSNHWDQVVAPLQSAWQCPIYVEQSMHTMDLVYTAARAGAVIHPLNADSDKYTRAVPAARRMRGQILFPPAVHWWEDFEEELLAFPHAAHDDQMDVLSYAHRVRGAIWTPPPGVPPKTPAPPVVVTKAFGSNGVDLRNTPL